MFQSLKFGCQTATGSDNVLSTASMFSIINNKLQVDLKTYVANLIYMQLLRSPSVSFWTTKT